MKRQSQMVRNNNIVGPLGSKSNSKLDLCLNWLKVRESWGGANNLTPVYVPPVANSANLNEKGEVDL